MLYKSLSTHQLRNNIKNQAIKIEDKPFNQGLVFDIIKQDYLDNETKYKELFTRQLLFIGYLNKMNQKKNSKYLKAEVYLPNFIINTMNFYKEQIPLGFIPIESVDNLFREVKAVNWDKYPEIKQNAEENWKALRDDIYHQLEEIILSCKMISFSNKANGTIDVAYKVNEVNRFKVVSKTPKCKVIKNLIKGLLIFHAINLKCDHLDFFLSMDLIELFKYKIGKGKDCGYLLASPYSTRNPKKLNGEFYQIGELKKLVVLNTITSSEIEDFIANNHVKLQIKK